MKKIIIETVTLSDSLTLPSKDAQVFSVDNIPGYDTYNIKLIVECAWSDKYAVVIP